jgi:hypothetical protein
MPALYPCVVAGTLLLSAFLVFYGCFRRSSPVTASAGSPDLEHANTPAGPNAPVLKYLAATSHSYAVVQHPAGERAIGSAYGSSVAPGSFTS